MGFPPPVNGPPPSLTIPGPNFATGVSASTTVSTPVLPSICGFGIPPIAFTFGINVTFIFDLFPIQIPIPYFQLPMLCDVVNMLAVAATLPYGGGRVPNADPDPDYAEQALAA